MPPIPPPKDGPGPDFQRTDPKLLSRMFRASDEPETWRSEDLAAMLRHQLAAALAVDLEQTTPGAAQQVAELTRQLVPPIVTFRDLLWHPQPPVPLLSLVKDFAKANTESPGMPHELASVFYFASIALATRGGASISSLSRPRVRQGLLWTLQQSWLDDATRALLISLTPPE